jgi:hypothetical protein
MLQSARPDAGKYQDIPTNPLYWFGYHQVLEAFILHKQRMLCLVDKMGDAFAPVQAAPDKGSSVSRVKLFAVPVGFETQFYFFHLPRMSGNDAVIPGIRNVFCFLVQ